MRDWIFMLLVTAISTLALFALGDCTDFVDEDAAMVLRYSRNLSEGWGFAWNKFGEPEDGATDLLAALLCGLLGKFGCSQVSAMTFLTGGAHLGSLVTVYTIVRRSLGRRSLLPMTIVAILLPSPAYVYIRLAFATTVFVFACCVVVAVEQTQPSEEDYWLVKLGRVGALLVPAIARPEGVFVSIVVWCFFLSLCPTSVQIKLRVREVLAAAIVGSLFLCVRYSYFGHWLPIPFYKKSGGPFLSSLTTSATNVCSLLLPLAFLLLVPKLTARVRWNRLVALAIGVLVFVVFWSFFSDAQNVAGRFQYPILFVVACMFGAIHEETDSVAPNRSLLWNLLSMAVVAFVAGAYWNARFDVLRRLTVPAYQGTHAAARVLSKYSSSNMRLVTTEAGILSAFSDWTTLDAWGLNSYSVARNGLSLEVLRQFRPDMVMLNVNARGYNIPELSGDLSWILMCSILLRFVSIEGYSLVAVFAGNFGFGSIDLWFARPGCSACVEIGRGFENIQYGYGGQPWPFVEASVREDVVRAYLQLSLPSEFVGSPR